MMLRNAVICLATLLFSGNAIAEEGYFNCLRAYGRAYGFCWGEGYHQCPAGTHGGTHKDQAFLANFAPGPYSANDGYSGEFLPLEYFPQPAPHSEVYGAESPLPHGANYLPPTDSVLTELNEPETVAPHSIETRSEEKQPQEIPRRTEELPSGPQAAPSLELDLESSLGSPSDIEQNLLDNSTSNSRAQPRETPPQPEVLPPPAIRQPEKSRDADDSLLLDDQAQWRRQEPRRAPLELNGPSRQVVQPREIRSAARITEPKSGFSNVRR